MVSLLSRRGVAAWFVWAVVSTFATAAVSAQQNEKTPPQPEFFVEFHIADGCLFAPINGPAKQGSFLYALPRAANYLPDSSGQPIPSTVAVYAEEIGDHWKVRVAIGLGEFFDAGGQDLASFTLRTNERVYVGEAARFGLTPFRVGIVKVLGQSARTPRVITSKTPSISVEKLETNALPEPYRLFLKNNSDKHVSAIQYNTFKDQKFLHLYWLSGPRLLPLIKAGETYKFEVPSQDRTCADPDGYRPAQSNRIEIASVVFTDGSYEGDTGLATLVRGKALGHKQSLERVMATLINVDAQSSPELLMSTLKSLSDGMDEVADPSVVAALQNSLPLPVGQDTVKALTNLIRFGQHDIRTSLLRDAQQLEGLIKTQNIEAIRKFCVDTVAKYTQWLALAEAVSVH